MMSRKLQFASGARWLGISLLLLSLALPQAAAQGAITLEQVLAALKSGSPSQTELGRRVAELGVAFALDRSNREQLLRAGAKAPLIEAIEKSGEAKASAGGQPGPEVTVFSGEAVSGDEGPLTRERILTALRNKADQALLAGLVSQYGIAFSYTPELGREFQTAGANAALLSMIATATVGSSSVPEGFLTLPLAKARDFDGAQTAGRLDIRLYVDGAAEIRIQGNTALFKSLQAQEPRNAGSETTGIFPMRPLKKLEITKKDGRGSFVVLQRPSAENEFQTVLRIYDPKAGEDRYHLRILWEAE
ncbi:MAG: hypothetical protein IT169_04805 [Bryobacterales bacterium]|nr:hypothetical protein [Bryobacterales bacterium]